MQILPNQMNVYPLVRRTRLLTLRRQELFLWCLMPDANDQGLGGDPTSLTPDPYVSSPSMTGFGRKRTTHRQSNSEEPLNNARTPSMLLVTVTRF